MHGPDIEKKIDAMLELLKHKPDEAKKLQLENTKKRLAIQNGKPCPLISYKNYVTSAEYFDFKFSCTTGPFLEIMLNVKQSSHLKEHYKDNEHITVTTFNLSESLRNKAPDKNPNDIFETLITEPYRLGIKIVFARHLFKKNGEKDQLLMCHKRVATLDENNNVVVDEPPAMRHKLIAYLCVKGLLNERDILDSNLEKGIHIHPIEAWKATFEAQGIKRFDFIKEEVSPEEKAFPVNIIKFNGKISFIEKAQQKSSFVLLPN